MMRISKKIEKKIIFLLIKREFLIKNKYLMNN